MSGDGYRFLIGLGDCMQSKLGNVIPIQCKLSKHETKTLYIFIHHINTFTHHNLCILIFALSLEPLTNHDERTPPEERTTPEGFG